MNIHTFASLLRTRIAELTYEFKVIDRDITAANVRAIQAKLEANERKRAALQQRIAYINGRLDALKALD